MLSIYATTAAVVEQPQELGHEPNGEVRCRLWYTRCFSWLPCSAVSQYTQVLSLVSDLIESVVITVGA